MASKRKDQLSKLKKPETVAEKSKRFEREKGMKTGPDKEKGLEDADFVPAASPVGLSRKAAKMGVKAAGKAGSKWKKLQKLFEKPPKPKPKPKTEAPKLDYSKMEKPKNPKRDKIKKGEDLDYSKMEKPKNPKRDKIKKGPALDYSKMNKPK